jgi:hypothetical protein
MNKKRFKVLGLRFQVSKALNIEFEILNLESLG